MRTALLVLWSVSALAAPAALSAPKSTVDKAAPSRVTATAEATRSSPEIATTEALERPPVPPVPPWTAPIPVARTTAAGTRVLVLSQQALPLVHVVATVAAGSALDPPAQPGLAAATAMMLQEGGAGRRSGAALAEALAALGANLSVRVDPDQVQLSMTVLARNLDRALALLADVLARPRFDQAEWPHARARRLDEIRRRRDRPADLADDLFNRVLYGAHPYGHRCLGTIAAVGALSVADLRQFYARHYGPRTIAFAFYGDLSPGAAARQVARTLRGWSAPAEPPPPPPLPVATPPRLVLVDRPGAPQSELRVGHLGRDRHTPDYAAVTLLETVLGGSFTSRLNQNLRERHGYTYGARASFDLLNTTGPFFAAAAVRTDVTAAALRQMVSELKAIRHPLTLLELDKGRALVLQSLVEAFGSGQRATLYLADMARYGLPPDYWSHLPNQLRTLTLPLLTRDADQLFFPDRLTVVIVGDRKAIEPTLRQLALGKKIEYLDEDGQPVK